VSEMAGPSRRWVRHRVAASYDKTVEQPSDLDGLAYKQKLGKQLEHAGSDVNFSRMP
jgi:hypothetical protein